MYKENKKTFPLLRNCRLLAGFTLIELMVVVIIVGILAGIALPQYIRSRERAMSKQARAILSLIRAAERAYKMETGDYYPASGTVTSISTISNNLNLDLVDDGNWDYTVDGSSSGTHFEAELSREAGGYDYNWKITDTMVNATCSPTGSCP